MFYFANNIRASACLCSFLIFSLARPSYFFSSRTVCLYDVATAVSAVDVVVFVTFFSLARNRLQHRKWMASLKKYATLWQPLPNNWIIHCENHRLDYILMFIYTRIQWIITFYRMYILFNMDIGRYHKLTISLTFLFHFPHLYNNKAQDTRHHVVRKAIR